MTLTARAAAQARVRLRLALWLYDDSCRALNRAWRNLRRRENVRHDWQEGARHNLVEGCVLRDAGERGG